MIIDTDSDNLVNTQIMVQHWLQSNKNSFLFQLLLNDLLGKFQVFQRQQETFRILSKLLLITSVDNKNLHYWYVPWIHLFWNQDRLQHFFVISLSILEYFSESFELNKWKKLGNYLLESEWNETVSSSFIELGLELHPVQPQRVQECRQSLHQN